MDSLEVLVARGVSGNEQQNRGNTHSFVGWAGDTLQPASGGITTPDFLSSASGPLPDCLMGKILP